MDNDTITAPATFPSLSAIGVIRISGGKTRGIMSSIFTLKNGKKPDFPHRSSVRGLIAGSSGIIDEAVAVFYESPRSYTGEDMAEISCHGNPFIVSAITSLICSKGGRIASPGEFTKRAFLNGKMDLSAAEAVKDIISAENKTALKLALSQLLGSENRAVSALREKLLSLMSEISAAIEFPEDAAAETGSFAPASAMDDLRERLLVLADIAGRGAMLKNGIRTVIIGRPNSGKSSLLNALAGTQRAIVTPSPGTTRDIIEVPVEIDGLPFKLVDTAGIRESSDAAEIEGVRLAKKAAAEADIALVLIDAGSSIDTEHNSALFNLADSRRSIAVVNKTDLNPAFNPKDIEKLAGFSGPVALVSALKKTGLDSLTNTIKSIIMGTDAAFPVNDIVITNLRHKEALLKAAQSLGSAVTALKNSAPVEPQLELVFADLKEAASFLGEITGAITDENLLEKIFADFCIGK
ncbi:MAG TPA: tRNA uridine-5-carboxymethylaminomethyl(34) synthesis GTPase MnmE [bacterium]|nr:tRNA uridine-5-carboxymethylaminomethyl(34) synthesis GTPase MnmE [bacterium]